MSQLNIIDHVFLPILPRLILIAMCNTQVNPLPVRNEDDGQTQISCSPSKKISFFVVKNGLWIQILVTQIACARLNFVGRQIMALGEKHSTRQSWKHAIDVRQDEWGDQDRLHGAVSDLHAADARYHSDYKPRFMAHSRAVNAVKTRYDS